MLKHINFLFLTVVVFATVISPSMAQTKMDSDSQYAVIYTYFSIGDDSAPSYNVTKEQFLSHIDELKKSGYAIKPLPDIVQKFKQSKKIGDRTIAITFDGADKSIIDVASPILIANKIPFTIFIPATRISDTNPTFISWDDLRDLQETGLVSFGLHPATYTNLTQKSLEEIKRHINNSLIDIRKNLNINPKLFAYPFGEYDSDYQKIVQDMGFDAAFGQQSGAAYSQGDMFSLPRFTVTESYADMDRLVMSANSLPFPVHDISPPSPLLNSAAPSIGFTLPDEFSSKDKKSIKCHSSTGEKPSLSFLENRVEIRLSNLDDERPRLNCTIPHESPDAREDTRWRWLGFLFIVPNNDL